LLVTVHLGVAIFLALAIIARFISYLPQPDSPDAFENTHEATYPAHAADAALAAE
jgi:hypothetical protein